MPEGAWLYVWLGLSALAAGVVNSVAGGGTLLTFPALLTAVPPVIANGTSTVALVPGSLSAAWGFRGEMRGAGRWLLLLVVPSLVGGFVGSRLVTRVDWRYFELLIPWLILTATLLFLVQPLLTRAIRTGPATEPSLRMMVAVVFFQFIVAVYGGYFGAGIGILMLGALSLMGLGDIHLMNGLKNVLAACINGISVGNFILDGAVNWQCAAVMAPAALIGAYAGSRLAQRLDRRLVRWAVITIGLALAGHFFYQRWTNG